MTQKHGLQSAIHYSSNSLSIATFRNRASSNGNVVNGVEIMRMRHNSLIKKLPIFYLVTLKSTRIPGSKRQVSRDIKTKLSKSSMRSVIITCSRYCVSDRHCRASGVATLTR